MTHAVAAETAFRSAHTIEGAETIAAIEDEVRVFAGPLGYDRFVLFSASAAPDEVVERIYWIEVQISGEDRSICRRERYANSGCPEGKAWLERKSSIGIK